MKSQKEGTCQHEGVYEAAWVLMDRAVCSVANKQCRILPLTLPSVCKTPKAIHNFFWGQFLGSVCFTAVIGVRIPAALLLPVLTRMLSYQEAEQADWGTATLLLPTVLATPMLNCWTDFFLQLLEETSNIGKVRGRMTFWTSMIMNP